MRPYEPGDDVRLIDWNVTARTREPHIRVQLAERVLVTWVVLDQTPSMGFGTADRRKADVATGVALALGHAASARGNRVGLTSFGGGCADAAAAPPGPHRPRRAPARARRRGRPRRRSRAGAGALAARCRRAAAGARRRRLRLSRPARLAACRSSTSPPGTTCSPSRSAIRARTSSSTWGRCGSRIPETGGRLRVDTSDATPADAIRGGRRRRSGARSRPTSPQPARRTSCSRREATGSASSPRISGSADDASGRPSRCSACS